MAVGHGALDGEDGLRGAPRLPAEEPAERLDLRRRPVGEIREGALANGLPLAPRFPQQEGWAGGPVGDSFDVHGYYYTSTPFNVKHNIIYTWVHSARENTIYLRTIQGLIGKRGYSFGGNFGLDGATAPSSASCSRFLGR